MRLTIAIACIMFALGAVAGRMTVNSASAMAETNTISPFEMMKSAYNLPVESYSAI